MLLVDPRAGSKDLIKPLAAMGLPVETYTLAFGDLAFVGRGIGGAPVYIGIEHKRISDLVQSLEGRLPGHQLPGMVQTYDRTWLVVEGDWRSDTSGRTVLFKPKGGRRPIKGAGNALILEQRLLTLETRGGMHIRCCPTRSDSLRFLCALYRFWTDKDLDAHKSHLAIHAPDLDRGLQIPISDYRRMLAQVPGIGLQLSAVVEQQFPGFTRLLTATVEEWAALTTTDHKGKTRRLGASRAAAITQELRKLL